MPPSLQKLGDTEGIDFVRCRICGARRRVIATKHLSKHDTDRETYIEEYDLSPDDLIAKDFRSNRSSRHDFRPYSSASGFAAMKAARRRTPEIFTSGISKRVSHSLIGTGSGSSVTGTMRSEQRGSTRIACGTESRGVTNNNRRNPCAAKAESTALHCVRASQMVSDLPKLTNFALLNCSADVRRMTA